MTPIDVEVLMHYASIKGVHPRSESRLVINSIDKFLLDNVLHHDKPNNFSGSLELTPKGECLVQMILRTPYPRQVWVDQNNEVILI